VAHVMSVALFEKSLSPALHENRRARKRISSE
jgi:hypothetical protein